MNFMTQSGNTMLKKGVRVRVMVRAGVRLSVGAQCCVYDNMCRMQHVNFMH